jgi:protein-disulfide isomerase
VLFAHQDRLTDADLIGYGAQLGVPGVCGEAAQGFRAAVEADYRSGAAAGVRGTPTLFIDGARYSGKVKLDELRRILDR